MSHPCPDCVPEPDDGWDAVPDTRDVRPDGPAFAATQVGDLKEFMPGFEYVGSRGGEAFVLTGRWQVIDVEPGDSFIIEPRDGALVDGRPASAGFYCYYGD